MDETDSEVLLARLMQAGDVYRVRNRKGLRLLTGNAGALEIVVDGKKIPEIGPLGAVLRNVVLDPQQLLNGTAISELIVTEVPGDDRGLLMGCLCARTI